MDVALSVEILIPGAKYGGSTTLNSRDQFESLRWEDDRKKPTWEQLETAWAEREIIPEKKTIEERVLALEGDTKKIDDRLKEVETAKEVAK
jgi:hypothetical protein